MGNDSKRERVTEFRCIKNRSICYCDINMGTAKGMF